MRITDISLTRNKKNSQPAIDKVLLAGQIEEFATLVSCPPENKPRFTAIHHTQAPTVRGYKKLVSSGFCIVILTDTPKAKKTSEEVRKRETEQPSEGANKG